jgi:hypothetical protein
LGVLSDRSRPPKRKAYVANAAPEIVNTVCQAFIELEKRGLVEARQKSGYYTRPLLDHILPAPLPKTHRPRPKKVAINTLAYSIVEAMGDKSAPKLGAPWWHPTCCR